MGSRQVTTTTNQNDEVLADMRAGAGIAQCSCGFPSLPLLADAPFYLQPRPNFRASLVSQFECQHQALGEAGEQEAEQDEVSKTRNQENTCNLHPQDAPIFIRG